MRGVDAKAAFAEGMEREERERSARSLRRSVPPSPKFSLIHALKFGHFSRSSAEDMRTDRIGEKHAK